MTQIQEDVLGACNGLIKKQIDLIEEYSKKGITHEQMMPIVGIRGIDEFFYPYLSSHYCWFIPFILGCVFSKTHCL